MNKSQFLFSLFFFLFSFIAIGQKHEKGQYVEVEARDNIADVLIYSGHIQEGTNKDTLYLLTMHNILVKIPYSDIIAMSTEKGKLSESTSSKMKKSRNEEDHDWEIEEYEEPIHFVRRDGILRLDLI